MTARSTSNRDGGVAAGIWPVGSRQTQTRRDVEEDIYAVVHATEGLLARSHGEDRYVGQRVDTLGGVGGERAVGNETGWAVFRIDEVVGGGEARNVGSWQARAVLVHEA